MLYLFDLAAPIPPVAPETRGVAVYERFQQEPDLLAIAVVDEDGWPLGLIERNAFALKMGGPYGRSLYAGRPVTMVMDDKPTVADGGVSIQAFTEDSLLDRPANLMHGFIVTREGRYAGVGTALSLLQAQTAEIRRHASQVQAALRAKTEFLAVMSHEIRTPLNGVLAVAEVMDRQLRQPELKPYVQTILGSGQTLLRLLNDALDLSRAEAGKLDMKEEAFRIRDLVDDVEALWRARASETGIVFIVSLDCDGALWAVGDVVRLKQVLNNLVGNALKFTKAGSVEVRIAARRRASQVAILAEVVDTGPGIAADQLGQLFQPFSQTAEGREAGGAGLGLSICRQLIEKMDGQIWARSNPGLGSTFAFDVSLPMAEAPPASASEVAPEATRESAYVLIADDNATNRMVAETLCQMFGFDCESVENGEEAVRRAQERRLDLILMDIKMPVMDGLEAARRIRHLNGLVANVPIIALTANADPADADAYMRQGFDAVVEKPIRANTLMAAMNRLLIAAAEGEPLQEVSAAR